MSESSGRRETVWMRGVKNKQARGAPGQVEAPPYDVVALVLQGGGALGAYQAGVYQALHEVDIEPDWVSAGGVLCKSQKVHKSLCLKGLWS